MALFPMVARSHVLNEDTFRLLDKGLLYAGLIAGMGVLMYGLFPGRLIGFLFGQRYVVAAPLLGLFGLAMWPLSLVGILMNFNLARRRVGFIYSMAAACLLEVGLVVGYHGSLSGVLFIWLMSNDR